VWRGMPAIVHPLILGRATPWPGRPPDLPCPMAIGMKCGAAGSAHPMQRDPAVVDGFA